jgi:DNA-binding response OmpR family regulator
MRVLLVEDDAEFAEVVVRNLRARGHLVRAEIRADEAWASLMDEWPDTIILDVNLPDASGWELLRGLSQKDRDELHVVVISGAPFSQIRIAELVPAHTLLKPFPIRVLVAAVEDSAPDAGEPGRRLG